eukprot:COSAG01_NODE_19_length_39011_cov_38.134968_23_plen_57_part_00
MVIAVYTAVDGIGVNFGNPLHVLFVLYKPCLFIYLLLIHVSPFHLIVKWYTWAFGQ